MGKNMRKALTGSYDRAIARILPKRDAFAAMPANMPEGQGGMARLTDRWANYWRNQTSRTPGILPKIRGPIVHACRVNEWKHGDLIGEDQFGNRYYQNNDYTMGRNRWVIYRDRTFEETYFYDSSDLPSEWVRWLN